ncbi:ATP synthase F1 subunit epsilon [bacterium]|nr:ATP synthase F1 subunit epsilon [bacterium]MBR6723184.1 ATP synthase F1 subunit epsilon [bacterium]
MKLKIITQERVVFDQDVDAVYSKGIDGEFGLLKGHLPMMTALDIGVTRAYIGDEVKKFTTMGGILQFKDEECLILTTLAEPGEEIDEARARQALEQAKLKLKNAQARMDAKRAEAAIARAEARLKARLSGESNLKM